MNTTESEIRSLADHWAESMRKRDVDAIMEHYSDDVFAFDVPPPHTVTGKAAVRQNIESWLKIFDGSIDVEFKDVSIVAGGDLAVLRQLARVSDSDKGAESGMWVRVTVCYQKQDGRWLVIHEHASVPLVM